MSSPASLNLAEPSFPDPFILVFSDEATREFFWEMFKLDNFPMGQEPPRKPSESALAAIFKGEVLRIQRATRDSIGRSLRQSDPIDREDIAKELGRVTALASLRGDKTPIETPAWVESMKRKFPDFRLQYEMARLSELYAVGFGATVPQPADKGNDLASSEVQGDTSLPTLCLTRDFARDQRCDDLPETREHYSMSQHITGDPTASVTE